MIIVVNSVPLQINGADSHPEWIEHIRRTLTLLPADHIRAIHHITARDRADYDGGSTNPVVSGRPLGDNWIMLDVDSFPKPLNNEPPEMLHYTLLHETGHVVGTAYRCLRYLSGHARRDDSIRRGYAAMLARPHNGRTELPLEHFADTYADFFFHTETSMATDDRMTALLQTPAFTRVTPTPSRRP